MDGTELTEYLASHRSGVLCAGARGGGHGVPVVFSYDAERRDLYVQHAHDPGGEPDLPVGSGDRVSIVSYDESGSGLASVVVEGRVEPLTEATLDAELLRSVDDLEIPVGDVLSGDHGDLLPARLDIESISGRRAERVRA
jgi:nitroimidazol reductase NimA-like FMN-containing flavoprotein (pyridoxamine 5'-phosphate oxidase superfamily)